MKSIISIDEATLEKGVAYARKYFRGTKIDDLVSQYSGKSADPENDAKLAFDSFARFCGAYAALRHTYNESGMFNGSIEDMNTQNFMDIPSGFGASLAGLKYLESREIILIQIFGL